jgi:NAD(P) transhydrogenase subunit beta
MILALSTSLQNLAYLVAAVLFILGLKQLSHPRTAVRGNMMGALGMLIAIVVTLLDEHVLGGWKGYAVIGAGILVGSAAGAWLATTVQMTAMPQMVALLNGLGGVASVLVAGAALHEAIWHSTHEAIPHVWGVQETIAIIASGLIGGVTFTGSLVAWGKLEEKYKWLDRMVFPMQKALNGALAMVVLALGIIMLMQPDQAWTYWVIVVIAFVLGVYLVTPIGGADMPVVISLLNSYSGMAGAATGFVLNNTVLIIAGSLVGASGIILTQIMCKAMNRSLTNVLFGGMGVATVVDKKAADAVYAKVKSAAAEEIAMLFDTARNVVIVPGYGMAVSQAQHSVRDLAMLLESRGINVEYAIHPVAGRMPGHMNVLLAEADVPYDKLKEMDEINAQMEQVDVAIVIGANDTVNPIARTDPKSPIAGMPIIDVDKARTVVVIKRSLSPGFAGIPNPLFANENTLMYFADGKKAIVDLIGALKAA